MTDQPSEYGRSHSMDKRLKAMGKPVPDQPSKESLERANEVWSQMAFLREERQIETLALEFDVILKEHEQDCDYIRGFNAGRRELSQQNVALVSALRTAIGYSFHRFVCAFKLHPPDKCNCGFRKMLDDMDVLLAPYAPAEEKEKP